MLRPILYGIIPLLLGGVLTTACDGDKGKADPKAKAEAPKTDEAKADEAKADEAKADEAKADEAKADETKAAVDDAAAEPAADDAAADGGSGGVGEAVPADGGKADDGKADDGKADGGKKDGGKKDGGKKAEPAGPKVDAKSVYLKKCKSCHGVKGNADTKLGKKHDIADWTKAGWKGKWPMGKVENIIINGKSGTKMKAFKEKLTPAEIKAVAKYSRSLGK